MCAFPKSGQMEEEFLGWSRRHCKALPESSPTYFQAHSPPQWEDEEAESPSLEFDLVSPPELWPDVEHFFQELAGKCREDGGNQSSCRTPSGEIWKVGRVQGMNGWYTKLVAGAGEDSRSRQYQGASPKDMGLFWAPPMDEWGVWH